jgi:nucleoside-diphosphate-sugar epimerase
MKMLVTGGTGFIGSHFLRAAIAADHEVIAFRRPGSSPRIPVGGPLEWIESELAELPFAGLGDLGGGCLVHFAASGVNPAKATWTTCFKVNVSESLACWMNAVDAGISRIIVCGSCFEYGLAGQRYECIPPDATLEPTGPYHASKAAASMAAFALAIDRKVEMAILRPFHVYGEGEESYRFWPSLQKAARDGADFPMTSGEQIRDFIDVQQVAKVFLDVATSVDLKAGQPVIQNVGTGVPQSLRSFAEAQWKASGAKGKLNPGEIPLRSHEVMRYVPEIQSRKRIRR